MAQLKVNDFNGTVALVNLVKNYEKWKGCDPALREYELYEACRGYWPKHANYMSGLGVDTVFVVHKGVILEIFKVQDWYDAGSTMRHPKYVDGQVDSARCEFVGTIVNDTTLIEKYKGNTVDFFDPPKRYPIRIIRDGVFVTERDSKVLSKDNQIKFKSLMERLVGDTLPDKISESMGCLQKSCEEIQAALPNGVELCVGIKNGYDASPFCFSGGEKLAELAFIGLNPGRPLSEWIKLTENTTWQELADFCAPAEGLKESQYNAYQCLSKEGVKNHFYQNVFLTSYALLGDSGKIFDDIPTARKEIGNDKKFTEAFLHHFDKHPVLNCEMLPYKSVSMSYSSDKLVGDNKYMDYVRGMLELILAKTKDDAYVIFQGGVESVKEVLNKFTDMGLGENIWKEEEFFSQSKNQKGERTKNKLFFAHWQGKRTIILTPVRKAQVGGYKYSLTDLVTRLKEYRSK